MKGPSMLNQRCNSDDRIREYVGDFQDPFMTPPNKHSIKVYVKIDGTICLSLWWQETKNEQCSHAIMLTNEQRKNLGEFLLQKDPELWIDVKE